MLRRHKPIGALVSILVVYGLVDLVPITLLPVLLAMLTVASVREHWAVATATLATTLVMIAMPYLHGDQVSFIMCGLAAVGASVTVGTSSAPGNRSPGRATTNEGLNRM